MENQKLSPFRRINLSLNNIKHTFNNLFLVPEDQEHVIADRPMMLEQINDTIAFAIQNRSLVRMQINLKSSVIEIDGYIQIARSGRLCITDATTNLTQILEDEQIRSASLI